MSDYDLATLKIEVDTSQLTAATTALNNFASASKNTASANEKTKKSATEVKDANQKLILTFESQINALKAVQGAMTADAEVARSSAVQRRLYNSVLASGKASIEASTIALAKEVEGLKQTNYLTTQLKISTGGLTDAEKQLLESRIRHKTVVKDFTDAIRAGIAAESRIAGDADAHILAYNRETEALKKLADARYQAAQSANIRQTMQRMVGESDEQIKNRAANKSYYALLEKEQKQSIADAKAASAPAPDVYAAAGIKSPQQRVAEINAVEAALKSARAEHGHSGIAAKAHAESIRELEGRWNLLVHGNSRHRGAIRQTAAAMASLTFEMTGAIYGVIALTGALASPALFGVAMLKRIEDAQTGIAGILLSMGTLNGKALTFGQAWQASGQYVKQVQQDSMKYGIEMGRLMEVNQAAMSGGLNAMLNLEQIQKVATAGAVAVSSLGLSSQQYVQEVRDLISGGIQPASSTLARSIGVTDALLKQWKAEGPGKVVKELTERLQGFIDVADEVRSKTLTGAWDILQARLAMLLSDEKGFGALKKAVLDVANYIGTVDISGKFVLNESLMASARTYWEMLKSIGGLLVSIGAVVKDLSPAITIIAQTLTVLVKELSFAFRMIGGEIATIATQAVAVAHLDFSGAANIGKIWAADAAAARKELDASIESTLAPEIITTKTPQGNFRDITGKAQSNISEKADLSDNEKLKADLLSRIAIRNQEIAQGEKLTEIEKEYAKWLKETKGAGDGDIDDTYRAIIAKEKLFKQNEESAKQQKDYFDELKKETEALDKRTEQYEFELSLIGKTGAEIEELTRIRERAAVSKAEKRLATDKTIAPEDRAILEAYIAAQKAADAAKGAVAGAKGDLDAPIKAAEEALTRMNAALERSQELSRGLASSFGAVGSAIGAVVTTYAEGNKTLAEIDVLRAKGTITAEKAEEQSTAASLNNYASMAAAAKGFFSEKTIAYKALQATEMTYRLMSMAMTIKAMIMDTAETSATVANDTVKTSSGLVAGAARMFAQSGWGGFVGTAAMLALIASMGGTRKGGSSGPAAQSPTESMAFGGTSATKSDSIEKSLKLLNETNSLILGVDRELLDSMQGLSSSITGLANAVAKQLSIPGGAWSTVNYSQRTAGAGVLAEDIAARFGGGKTTTRTTGIGLTFDPQTFGQAMVSGLIGSAFNTTNVEKSGGILTFGKKRSTTTTTYSAIDQQLQVALNSTITTIANSLISGAEAIGVNGASAMLAGMDTGLRTIDFIGLSGEQISEKIAATFSVMWDKAATKIAESIGVDLMDFAIIGEHAGETLTRLGVQIDVVDRFYSALGRSMTSTISSANDLATALGGISTGAKAMSSFIEKFAPDSVKLDIVRGKLTEAMLPVFSTTEEYWRYAQTASDAQLAALLNNLDAVNGYLDAAKKATAATNEEVKRLNDAAKSIREFSLSLTSVELTSAQLKTRFIELAQLSKTGDANAIGKLQSAATDYLNSVKPRELDLNKYATSLDAARAKAMQEIAYSNAVALVKIELDATASKLEEQAEIAKRSLDASLMANTLLAQIAANTAAPATELQSVATRGYASGGVASGWSVVGEEGAELVNFTQPGRVYTAKDTLKMFAANDDTADEIKNLRAELQAIGITLAKNTNETAKILRKFDKDGLPAERVMTA